MNLRQNDESIYAAASRISTEEATTKALAMIEESHSINAGIVFENELMKLRGLPVSAQIDMLLKDK